MANFLDEFTQHLEFLGYEVKPVDDDKVWSRAKHDARLDFTFRDFNKGVLLSTWFPLKTLTNDELLALLQRVNDLNYSATVTRTYYNKHGNMVMEAWFPAMYEKMAVANFMDRWSKEVDQRVFSKWDEFKPYWYQPKEEENKVQ